MQLLLLGMKSVSKESLMKMRVHMDDSDDNHEDEFKDKEDQTSLNIKDRFVPWGEMRGRGFRRDPR